jgi:hypothetical protein
MRLSRTALELLLQTSVVELRFRRRIEKAGYKDFRRMLCTNDRMLLNSQLGRNILNYNPPHDGGLKYKPAQKNLIIGWDCFMQNFRAINCNDVDVVSVIKTSPDPAEFWKYFNENLIPMSSDQKAAFMNT